MTFSVPGEYLRAAHVRVRVLNKYIQDKAICLCGVDSIHNAALSGHEYLLHESVS